MADQILGPREELIARQIELYRQQAYWEGDGGDYCGGCRVLWWCARGVQLDASRSPDHSVRRIVLHGVLAPRIIDEIAEERQPAELTLGTLTRRVDLPLLWSTQEQPLRI